MSVVDTKELFGRSAPRSTTGTNNRPKATIYLNFGRIHRITDANGEHRDVPVSLPYGLGLDNMEPRKVQTADPNKPEAVIFMEQMQAGNDMLAQMIQETKTKLKPGELRVIMHDPETGLACWIQRAKEEVAQTVTAGNRFAARFEF